MFHLERWQFLQRSGELYVCIGGGPAATASTGFMIGFVGMLRLHETAQKKTRRSQFLLGQNILIHFTWPLAPKPRCWVPFSESLTGVQGNSGPWSLMWLIWLRRGRKEKTLKTRKARSRSAHRQWFVYRLFLYKVLWRCIKQCTKNCINSAGCFFFKNLWGFGFVQICWVCHDKRLQKVCLDPEIFRIGQPVVFEMLTVPDDFPRETYDFELPDESSWT